MTKQRNVGGDPSYRAPSPMTEADLNHILTAGDRVKDDATVSVYSGRRGSVAGSYPFEHDLITEFPKSEMEAIKKAEENRLAKQKEIARLLGNQPQIDNWIVEIIAAEAIESATISFDSLLASGKVLGYSNKARSCRCLVGGCLSRTKRCKFDPTQQDFLIGGHNEK